MRTGLFGGTFDPIHNGHLIQAQELLHRGPLDRIVFIPAARPPHKSQIGASASDRFAMVAQAIAGDTAFEVSPMEMDRPGPSYTIDTIREFAAANPDEELRWIIGADSLPELVSWRGIGEILEEAPFLIAARRGFSLTASPRFDAPSRRALIEGIRETPIIEISSTGIRDRVQRGMSISHRVPAAVEAYIRENGLYRSREPGS